MSLGAFRGPSAMQPQSTLIKCAARFSRVQISPLSQSRSIWRKSLSSISTSPRQHRSQSIYLDRLDRGRENLLLYNNLSRSCIVTTAQELSRKTLADYVPPTTGLISLLPPKAIPYAELMRLDKPTGTYYLFFPCLFSTLVAATMANPISSPLAVITTTGLFFTGALIMRGAGCTINDLWDRNLDPHVERTRLRPIARRAVTPQQAIVFLGGQLTAGLGVLLSLPFECFWYATPSLLLVTTYPLAKRVTYYPQFVLGLTFSWGAIMGFPALGIDLLSNQAAAAAAACLYTSNIAWTVLYDMIYAHLDIKDDVKAGIKSIALKHQKDTKMILSGLAVVQVGLLAATGVAAGMGPIFFAGTCGGAALTLSIMIRRVKLKEVKNCWWWFVNGAWFTGGAISLGLAAEYVAQLLDRDENSEKLKEVEQKVLVAA